MSALALALVAFPRHAAADERQYDLSGFDSISVATGIKASVEAGRDYTITAMSSEKGLQRLEVVVENGDLKLRRRTRGMNWGRKDGVKVFITLPNLTGIDASSGAHVTAVNIDADDFAIDASSGAHVTARGTCGLLEIDVSSGSAVEAKSLECRRVRADASSGARADVFAGEDLFADASSGAHLRASGDPATVRQDTSSGGSIALNRQ